MRGESRLCRGSNEPLLKLPDGALATRRIVFWLRGAALRSRAGARLAKACSAAKLCRRLAGGAGRGLLYRDANE